MFKVVVLENEQKIYEKDVDSFELAQIDADTFKMIYPSDKCSVVEISTGLIVYEV